MCVCVCVCTYPVPKSASWDYLMKTFNKEKYLTKRERKRVKKKKRNSLITCFLCFFFQTVFIQSKEYCYY